MAVPTGEYELAASVDLTPLFGIQKTTAKIRLEQPPADLLDRRLSELRSDDANIRRTALIDLRYFPGEGAKIVPALLEVVKAKDPTQKSIALGVLGTYPVKAAAHLDLFLGIMNGKGSDSERAGAAYLIARIAPRDEKIESALAAALEASEGYLKVRFESALKLYRRRHAPKKSGGPGGGLGG